MKARELRTCLQCHKRIFGRQDKKFCSNQCRSLYNNRAENEHLGYVRRINQALRKNWIILTELTQEKVPVLITREALIERAFDFSLHTGLEVTPTGVRTCYYNLCIEEHGTDQVLISMKTVSQ